MEMKDFFATVPPDSVVPAKGTLEDFERERSVLDARIEEVQSGLRELRSASQNLTNLYWGDYIESLLHRPGRSGERYFVPLSISNESVFTGVMITTDTHSIELTHHLYISDYENYFERISKEEYSLALRGVVIAITKGSTEILGVVK